MQGCPIVLTVIPSFDLSEILKKNKGTTTFAEWEQVTSNERFYERRRLSGSIKDNVGKPLPLTPLASKGIVFVSTTQLHSTLSSDASETGASCDQFQSGLSRPQSLYSSLSSVSPDLNEPKKLKDKSHRRKSHLNRAFTDEVVPENLSDYCYLSSERNSVGSFSHIGSGFSTDSSSRLEAQKSIQKAPIIPSIFNVSTTNESNIHQGSSSSAIYSASTSLGNESKLEKKVTPSIVKRDSFSDAEGVSFLKKLLQKESFDKCSDGSVKSKDNSPFALKKSTSSGSNSYWTRFSNSQPAFLRKFFEKSSKYTGSSSRTEQSGNKTDSSNLNSTAQTPNSEQEKEGETVMGFSVAEKASFFMKLEHDQRFSRWRKNSDTSEPVRPERSGSNARPRHLTQPVTPTEVEIASQQFDQQNKQDQSSTGESMSKSHDAISATDIKIGMTELLQAATQQFQRSVLFPYCERAPAEDEEPSALSLKDRVTMFDKIIATSHKTSNVSSSTPVLPSRFQGSAPKINGIIPLTPLFPNSSASNVSAAGFQSMSMLGIGCNTSSGSGEMYEDNSYPSNVVSKRRGSASDLDNAFKYSPLMSQRNSKVKSMMLTNTRRNFDAEASEDGEVSSGGQEVAEIISKSYENSPVFRKKTWKTQKETQANFTKEIWRRCANNNERWSHCSASYGSGLDNRSSFASQVAKATPATSNLLPILTALSSSNDELDSRPVSVTRRRKAGNNNDSSCMVADDLVPQNSTRVSVVHVPYPDDESFQKFFKSAHTNTCGTFLPVNKNRLSNVSEGGESLFDDEDLSIQTSFDQVQRQEDLLVLKKNVPILRRKSSGKSRNPLKALAARMDFRNQKYTDIHPTSSNYGHVPKDG